MNGALPFNVPEIMKAIETSQLRTERAQSINRLLLTFALVRHDTYFAARQVTRRLPELNSSYVEGESKFEAGDIHRAELLYCRT